MVSCDSLGMDSSGVTLPAACDTKLPTQATRRQHLNLHLHPTTLRDVPFVLAITCVAARGASIRLIAAPSKDAIAFTGLDVLKTVVVPALLL
jgi:hypothetical protein